MGKECGQPRLVDRNEDSRGSAEYRLGDKLILEGKNSDEVVLQVKHMNMYDVTQLFSGCTVHVESRMSTWKGTVLFV
jgi:hypothetical protein